MSCLVEYLLLLSRCITIIIIVDVFCRRVQNYLCNALISENFTVRLRMHTHGLAVDICLSVCLSNAWIATKRNNLLPKCLYHEDRLI